MKPQNANKPRSTRPRQVLREGEFISRTQKPIYQVSTSALEIRAKGITTLRNAIAEFQERQRNAKDTTEYDACHQALRELVSAMNFSVREAEKALASRKGK